MPGIISDLKRLISLEPFFSKEYGMEDLLLPLMFVDDGIILNKDGSFSQSFWYHGPDLVSSPDEDLETLNTRTIPRALYRLQDGWVLHNDFIRREVSSYIREKDNYFPEVTSYMIDFERNLEFKENKNHYENTFIITFTFLPPADFIHKSKNWFIENNDTSLNISYFEHLQHFKNTLKELLDMLSYQIFTVPLTNAETMKFYNFAINGFEHNFEENLNFNIDLNYKLANQDVIAGSQPKIGDFYVGVISVGEGLPTTSYTSMLYELSTLKFNYRWSTRFIFFSKETSAKEFDRTSNYYARNRESFKQSFSNSRRTDGFEKINRSADVFADMSQDALEKLETEMTSYGKLTVTVIVMDKNKDALQVKLDEVAKVLNNKDFLAKKEHINAFDAYLGSIPGMVINNVRKHTVSSINLADIMLSTSTWTGYRNNPCRYYVDNNPPLFYALADGGTPFRGCSYVGDTGHLLILGPSLSGKTTFVNFLIAQHFRYKNAQCFVFDRNYSTLNLCNAMNGTHYDIGGENSIFKFKPLNLLDNVEDFSFLSQWLADIAELNLNRRLNSDERNDIVKILEIIKAEGNPEHKTMSYFYLQIKSRNKNSELANAFSEYSSTLGKNTIKSSIFNSVEDHLRLNKFVTFEIDKLLKFGDEVFIPAIKYILYMLVRSLDGSPTFILFEGGDAILKNKILIDMVEDLLRTVGKKNVFIGICSQQINDILNSEISDVLIEQCKTHIYLPNNAINTNENTRKIYEKLGLNKKQLYLIGSARPQREYYFSNSLGNRLIDLNLSNTALAFLGKTSVEDIKLSKEFKIKYKDEFAYYWLKRFNQTDAAEFWAQKNKEFMKVNPNEK